MTFRNFQKPVSNTVVNIQANVYLLPESKRVIFNNVKHFDTLSLHFVSISLKITQVKSTPELGRSHPLNGLFYKGPPRRSIVLIDFPLWRHRLSFLWNMCREIFRSTRETNMRHRFRPILPNSAGRLEWFRAFTYEKKSKIHSVPGLGLIDISRNNQSLLVTTTVVWIWNGVIWYTTILSNSAFIIPFQTFSFVYRNILSGCYSEVSEVVKTLRLWADQVEWIDYLRYKKVVIEKREIDLFLDLFD